MIQFDLVKDNVHEKKKKENAEFRNVKDALTWEEKPKSMVMQERKAKWQTENRDCFRAFLDSPEKVVGNEEMMGMEQSGQDLSGMPDNYSGNADPDQDFERMGDNFAFVPGKHVTILDKEALAVAEAA